MSFVINLGNVTISAPKLDCLEMYVQQYMRRASIQSYKISMIFSLAGVEINFESEVDDYYFVDNLREYLLNETHMQFIEYIMDWIPHFPDIMWPDKFLLRSQDYLRNFPEADQDDLICFYEAKTMAQLYVLVKESEWN